MDKVRLIDCLVGDVVAHGKNASTLRLKITSITQDTFGLRVRFVGDANDRNWPGEVYEEERYPIDHEMYLVETRPDPVSEAEVEVARKRLLELTV